jgi:Raf kinase inhibitor-like YbhB/YbcL family protein
MRTPTALVLRCIPALLLTGPLVLLASCSDNGTSGGGNGGASANGGATTAGGAPSGGSPSGGSPSGGAASGGAASGGAASGGAASGGAASGGAASGGASAGGTTGTGGASGGAGGASGGKGGDGGAGGGAKGGAGGTNGGTAGAGGANGGSGGGTGAFSLTSPNHVEGAKFASKYTCADKGFNGSIMPELNWTEGPAGTKSYAITFIDVTLTKGGGSMANLGYHWEIHNIPPATRTLPEALSATQVTALGAKQSGAFLGPCPGGDTHTYEFTLYALGTDTVTFTGTGTAVVKDAETKLEASNLGKTKLTGTSNAKAP